MKLFDSVGFIIKNNLHIYNITYHETFDANRIGYI